MRRHIPLLIAAALIATTAPYGVAAATPSAGSTYDVTITRTEYGIPHIKANNFASAGYGFAYGFAQDNICVMADDYVTVSAERSKFFGPNNTYTQGGNCFGSSNLNSDI